MKDCRWLSLVLVVAALLPSIWRRHEAKDLAKCEANIKELVIALEMYSVPHGHYPPRMTSTLLEGYYLKDAKGNTVLEMPTCPSAGYDTYSDTYQATQNPDSFSFGCRGNNHGTVNHPWYNAEIGLLNHCEVTPQCSSLIVLCAQEAAAER